MIKRIDQQLYINRRMIAFFAQHPTTDKNLQAYMFKYAEIITMISSVLLIKEGSQESLAKKRELWQYIRKQDVKLYRKLRRGFFGFGVHLPGKSGHMIVIGFYRLVHKLYGFN